LTASHDLDWECPAPLPWRGPGCGQTVHLRHLQRIERDLDSLGTKVNKLTSRVDKLVGVVEGLAQIVTSHERRLNHLEG
jgi:hypothetical protein